MNSYKRTTHLIKIFSKADFLNKRHVVCSYARCDTFKNVYGRRELNVFNVTSVTVDSSFKWVYFDTQNFVEHRRGSDV